MTSVNKAFILSISLILMSSIVWINIFGDGTNLESSSSPTQSDAVFNDLVPLKQLTMEEAQSYTQWYIKSSTETEEFNILLFEKGVALERANQFLESDYAQTPELRDYYSSRTFTITIVSGDFLDIRGLQPTSTEQSIPQRYIILIFDDEIGAPIAMRAYPADSLPSSIITLINN